VAYIRHTHTTDTFIFAASSAREHSAMHSMQSFGRQSEKTLLAVVGLLVYRLSAP
jgi:hypothetical protein